MLKVDGCDCLFCSGENGRKLVSVSFQIVEAAGLVAEAKRARVTIKPTDLIFVANGLRAVGCVRVIRRHLARMCGCYVAKELRGQGIGSLLVRHRVAFVERHLSASAIDTYAFNSRLYRELGFTTRESYKIGTTLLRKVIQR